MKTNLNANYKLYLFKVLTAVSLLGLQNTFANIEGGSRDGGGGLSVGNSILDIYEDSNGGIDLKSFDPSKTKAFLERLQPRLRTLDLRIPGIYDEITSGLTDKKWFFTNSKIKASNDACLLIEVKTTQIAKQDSKNVVISRTWFTKPAKNQETLLEKQEALLLHELFTSLYNKLHGRNENCSTHIRDAVRLILTAETKSDTEIRDKLVELGFPKHATKLEMEKILGILSPLIKLGCSIEPPTKEPSKLAFDSLDEFNHSDEAIKALNNSESESEALGNMRLSLGNLHTALYLYINEPYETVKANNFYEVLYRTRACENLKKWIARHTSKFSQ